MKCKHNMKKKKFLCSFDVCEKCGKIDTDSMRFVSHEVFN